ncbi:release factor [Mytilinidion resinicola]|uniref:Release factor n=1 Tax=Mytilinidion resinicola TaxID=574789 RepID=A0A6A6YU72_9PEZI|nr:release factor [Mytilinidion resinicola]KAF2812079.1 release factor [Mytilinidion resinicola]
MSAIPWICRPCLLRSLRPLRRRQIRFQTSLASNDALSTALLSRARTVAAEHDQLTQKLAAGFDSKTAKKLGEIGPVSTALADWDKATASLSELQSLIHDPTTDPELRELAADDMISTADELAAAARSLKTSLVPKHPFANLPCLLEIRPGAGGSEAAIFAGDLLRMYQAFCSRSGYRTSVLKLESADILGSESTLAEAVLEIESAGAYGLFRCEAGVHRVQRVPATESKGRVHTSAVSVLVLPSFPSSGAAEEMDLENPESDYYVDPKEVRTEIMRARGAGGQHVNTTDSAVRLTHLPTMTSVSMQDYRSQPKNREKAWQLLRSRLAQARREKREEEMVQMRRNVVGVAKMGRGDKVRTYNWGQQRVTDHRSGLTVHGLDDVMDGGMTLEKVMESVRTWLMERDVEALVAEEEESKNGK